MNINLQALQPLIDTLGKHLARQLSIISIVWTIIGLIVITFVVKRTTKWPFMVPVVVTLFATQFLGLFLHIPFDLINKLFTEPEALNLRAFFQAQPTNTKLLLLAPLLLWKSLTAAIVYQWSFKLLTYFDKKRTYDFGLKFFLYLFAACSLPSLFTILHLIIYMNAF